MTIESMSDVTKYKGDSHQKRRRVCFGVSSNTVFKGNEPEKDIGLTVPHFDMAGDM